MGKSPKSDRRVLTTAEQALLVSESNGVCVLCSNSLIYGKANGKIKKFEAAHIYPLHPTEIEIKLLEGEERLSADPNALENLIPLCPGCHTVFDKEKSVDEYRDLCQIKKQLMAVKNEVQVWNVYPLLNEINRIISLLCASAEDDIEQELSLIAKLIDEKVKGRIDGLTRRKIHAHVDQYYFTIRDQLAQINRESAGTAETIASQIRTYYLDQCRRNVSYSEIYNNLSKWIGAKTQAKNIIACEIIVSFFVQNCEVFS